MFIADNSFPLGSGNDSNAQRFRQIQQGTNSCSIVSLKVFFPHFTGYSKAKDRLRAIDAMATSEWYARIAANLTTTFQYGLRDFSRNLSDGPSKDSNRHKR